MNPNSNNINNLGSVRLANANGGFTGSTDIKAKVLPSNPFVSFGWILFGLSVIACMGLFFYDRQLSIKSNNTLKEVISYKNAVESVNLTDIKALMDKLSTFNELSLKHNRPTTILSFLEVVTNKNVAWSAFDYKVKDKDKYEINLFGKALSYKYVIQQMDELKSGKYDKYIKNIALTALNKTQEPVKNKGIISQASENRDIINFAVRFEIVDPTAVDIFDQFIEGNVNTSAMLNTSIKTLNNNTVKVPVLDNTNVGINASSSDQIEIQKLLKMLDSGGTKTIKK